MDSIKLMFNLLLSSKFRKEVISVMGTGGNPPQRPDRK